MTGTPGDWYDTGRPEVVKLFSKMLWGEWRKKDALFDERYGFAGNPRESLDKMIYIVDEPNKQSGDKVTVPYDFEIADEPGVVGNEVLEGKEGNIETETFAMQLNKQRHGVRVYGEMVNQRVHFDAAQQSKNRLANWWKRRRAAIAWNHLCANTVKATDQYFNGHNTVQSIDAGHVFRPGVHTTDQAVQGDTSATLDVDLVDELVGIVELLTPPVRPFIFQGNEYYALFMHNNQATDLRNVNTQWYTTMQNALQGGVANKNPLFTRALGKWRNVLFFSDPYITQGVHSSSGAQLANTRRAVLCGAGALALTYGRHYGYGDSKFRWFASTWDHGDKWYASASLIWGVSAISVPINGTQTSLGRMVLPTYSRERVAGLGNVGQP